MALQCRACIRQKPAVFDVVVMLGPRARQRSCLCPSAADTAHLRQVVLVWCTTQQARGRRERPAGLPIVLSPVACSLGSASAWPPSPAADTACHIRGSTSALAPQAQAPAP